MKFTVENYQNLIDVVEQRIKEADAHIIKTRRDLTIAEAQYHVWLEVLEMLQAAGTDDNEAIQAIVAEIVEVDSTATEAEKKYNV